MSRNDEVATRLEEFADLLEAKDVEYKPRTYRRAAENVRDCPDDVEALAAEGEDAVAEIEGVGEAISAKIVEYFETGEIAELESLREELPVEMAALTSVEGVGPKTVGTLYEELGVITLEDLEGAARSEQIQQLTGFGPKTEQNILDGIEFARRAHGRELLDHARPHGDRVLEALRGHDVVERCELAGSIRRWKPTVGDVDVLVGSEAPDAVVDVFTGLAAVDDVLQAGTSKASVHVDRVQVDLRVVDPDEFGAALQYFTGSKQHNVRLRNLALDRDLKVNEYGVFDVSSVEDPGSGQRVGDRIAGETEEGMYEALDLEWIPPELREDRGEIDAAGTGQLPDLLTEADICGDLHVHTDWSDGGNTPEEMIEAAASFGHEYLCVTDHATGPGIISGVGLDDETLLEQQARIRDLDETAPIDVYAGVEANIDEDGDISVGDDVLDELDLVVASPHSSLDGPGTDRLVAAVKHPAIDVIGHPTGRYLNRREGLDVDVERLARLAADHETALEINANPNRLDLTGHAVKRAIEQGATIAINTDAHGPESLQFLEYGVQTARRGWAGEPDVLNTRSAEDFREFVESTR